MIPKIWWRFLVFLSLCMGLVGVTSASLATLAYDGQCKIRIVYDGGLLSVFDYDSAEAPTVFSGTNPSAKASGFYGKSGEFLAAETTATVFRQGTFPDPATEWKGNYVNGQRTWKTYGPDRSEAYGGAQGIGGLESTRRDSDGVTVAPVHDQFGTIVANVHGGSLLWNPNRYTGYGPAQGYQPPALSLNVPVNDVLIWQGRRMDPIGYYWMGARYYDPRAGRFLSPDPLGHEASMDLYSYANGDPINYFDADGRVASKMLNQQQQYMNPYEHAARVGFMEGTLDFGLPLAKLSLQTLATIHNKGWLLNSAIANVFGGIEESAQGVFTKHTSSFTSAQGQVYAWSGFAGEIWPNLIAPAGLDAGVAKLMGRVEALAAKYLPVFAEDLAKVGGRLWNRLTGVADDVTKRGLDSTRSGGLHPGGTGRALAGHGVEQGFEGGFGSFVVPNGTTIMLPRSGVGIPDNLGQLIETGNWEAIMANRKYSGLMEGAASHLPGARVPELILYPATDRWLMQNSIRVNTPTPLSKLAQPGMGHLDWAACRECF